MIKNLITLCFLICLTLTGCFYMYSWVPENTSKKEWKENYGTIDTNNSEIQCEHYLGYDYYLYHQRSVIRSYYRIGKKRDTIQMISLKLFNNESDTLRYIATEADFGDTNRSAIKLFSFDGIKDTRQLNLFLNYSLRVQGKVDTIARLYKLNRRLFLMFRRND